MVKEKKVLLVSGLLALTLIATLIMALATYAATWARDTAPTANDDIAAGYAKGDLWLDEENHKLFIAESVTVASARWYEVYYNKEAVYTDESDYTIGGVTLTGDANWESRIIFAGTTQFQIWLPDIAAEDFRREIEFWDFGTGGISIYVTGQDEFFARFDYAGVSNPILWTPASSTTPWHKISLTPEATGTTWCFSGISSFIGGPTPAWRVSQP